MLKKLLSAGLVWVLSMGFGIAAVNINTASLEQLQTLPEIGPIKAQAIVDYRKSKGNFKTIDDIKNVKGIGEKTFDKLKPQIAVSGATSNIEMPAVKPAKDEKDSKAKDKKN